MKALSLPQSHMHDNSYVRSAQWGVHMYTVLVQPWVQSDTLRKSQTAGSAVDAAASDGTDADDVEAPAASASSTER